MFSETEHFVPRLSKDIQFTTLSEERQFDNVKGARSCVRCDYYVSGGNFYSFFPPPAGSSSPAANRVHTYYEQIQEKLNGSEHTGEYTVLSGESNNKTRTVSSTTGPCYFSLGV